MIYWPIRTRLFVWRVSSVNFFGDCIQALARSMSSDTNEQRPHLRALFLVLGASGYLAAFAFTGAFFASARILT